MPTSNISITGSVAGISVSGSLSRTYSGQIGHDVTVPAATQGVLASMDSAGTSGEVTGLDSSHSFAVSDSVAIFHDDANSDGTQTARYNVTVDSTATATKFSFDNTPTASGDSLGANDTTVNVGEMTETINTDFAGGDVLALALSCNKRCAVQFQEEDGTEIATFVLQANEPYVWAKDQGITNPLAGATVGQIAIAGGDTTSGTLKIGIGYDSDV